MKNQIQKPIRKIINFEPHFGPILDQFWERKAAGNGPKMFSEAGDATCAQTVALK